MNNKTLIIAEAGVNHNGDLVLAKQLIDTASQAGADYIKFQTFNAGNQATRSAKKADYQYQTTNSSESQYDLLSRLQLTYSMHEELIKHCRACNIGFLSSAFDIESIDLLCRYDIDFFKIPSGEITNLPYLRHIGKMGKKVILSTGMCTLSDIEAAICALEFAGLSRTMITLLHCTTEYPTLMTDVNLRAMQTMHLAFKLPVGYSDHTNGIEVSVAAVAMGATVIEKHITLDRSLPGPDHLASVEPAQFRIMVEAIRNIEKALGDGLKCPTSGELKNSLVVRKSIVATRLIKKGEIFTTDNITSKRPGNGISPMRWDDVLGRHARREYMPDDLIEL